MDWVIICIGLFYWYTSMRYAYEYDLIKGVKRGYSNHNGILINQVAYLL